MTTSYIAFIRDHSGSMRSIASHAARDYNASIQATQEEALASNQPTFVSVVELGYGSTADVRHVIRCQPVGSLTPILAGGYEARGGGTPLWDAVGAAIEEFEALPAARDTSCSFLVLTTTDGHENASRRYSASSIARKMQDLTATDRWTFVFRVPRGSKAALVRAGVPEWNILEWDQTSKGVEAAQATTTSAMRGYLQARASGQTSTKKFFASMADVKVEDVKVQCTNIGSQVTLLPVGQTEHDKQIRDFVEARVGSKFLKGAAFYQLTKTEPKVQDYKLIAVQHKQTGEVYAGPAARQMAGLPLYGDCRVAPADLGEWNVFIQSTSVNRKVVAGTAVLYWPGIGTAYTEGRSA